MDMTYNYDYESEYYIVDPYESSYDVDLYDIDETYIDRVLARYSTKSDFD